MVVDAPTNTPMGPDAQYPPRTWTMWCRAGV